MWPTVGQPNSRAGDIPKKNGETQIELDEKKKRNLEVGLKKVGLGGFRRGRDEYNQNIFYEILKEQTIFFFKET